MRAVLDVERGGESLGVVEAGKNAYKVERTVSNEVGVRTDYLTSEERLRHRRAGECRRSVYLRVFDKPLVNLLWLSAFIYFLGSLIALSPDAREQRRLELSEVRDRALAALKELELDHRTGKVSDDDYRSLLGPLRREAAEALGSLEPPASGTARVKAERSG